MCKANAKRKPPDGGRLVVAGRRTIPGTPRPPGGPRPDACRRNRPAPEQASAQYESHDVRSAQLTTHRFSRRSSRPAPTKSPKQGEGRRRAKER